jgi:hypothetical protein
LHSDRNTEAVTCLAFVYSISEKMLHTTCRFSNRI